LEGTHRKNNFSGKMQNAKCKMQNANKNSSKLVLSFRNEHAGAGQAPQAVIVVVVFFFFVVSAVNAVPR
jgi:hypothetical protein